MYQYRPLLVILIALISLGTGFTSRSGYSQSVECGAERTGQYLPLIQSWRLGVVANPSSRIGAVHLVDSLVNLDIRVTRIFAPEHGFRGEGEAGAVIRDGVDPVTGIPVSSLYAARKKPDPKDLAGLDGILFDIQDVGVRFYTYVSTLTYVMEACAEQHLPLVVLDRPNPNGFYVDGPVLDTAYRSFVGMHPVPVVHGMTLGEYARMVNGEGWLSGGISCNLTVIPCRDYDHSTEYTLPVKPSPNLPNTTSIYLYPSLCFFEGTVVSVGRGTPYPFQVFGHPGFDLPFNFTPESMPGASLHPKHEGKICHGMDLRKIGKQKIREEPRLHLTFLLTAFEAFGKQPDFFNNYFDRLAGSDRLRQQILAGWREPEIRESWSDELERFKRIRSQYLIYPNVKK